MECELKKNKDADETETSLIHFLEEQVKCATDKLLLTNFTACVDDCRHVVSAARSRHDLDPDTSKRLDEVREAATVIGIQALAEQGRWKEVLPFVEEVYTHIGACPANIIQMCLLLHAHVREFLVCHSLLSSWLDWDEHHSHPHSAAIVAFYVTHVLVPLGAYNLIPQVVERCSSLSSEERQNLLSPETWSPRKDDAPKADLGFRVPFGDQSDKHPEVEGTEKETELIPRSSEHPNPKKKHNNQSKVHKVITLYVRLSKRLWRCVSQRGWCRQIRRCSKLLFLVSFLLLTIVHIHTDFTVNWSGALEVWRTAMRGVTSIWRNLPQRKSVQ